MKQKYLHIKLIYFADRQSIMGIRNTSVFRDNFENAPFFCYPNFCDIFNRLRPSATVIEPYGYGTK